MKGNKGRDDRYRDLVMTGDSHFNVLSEKKVAKKFTS